MQKLLLNFPEKQKNSIGKVIFLVSIATFIFAGANAQQTGFITDTFKVQGVCGSCENRIEKALKIKGIQTAQWEVETKMLTVNYNPAVIKLESIHSKLAGVGHDTELKKASTEVYNALPDCCLYKNPENEGHYVSENAKTNSENHVGGVVLSEDNKGNFNPLTGASIMWEGSYTGVITDGHGVFSIPKDNQNKKLIISYTGYQPDSVKLEGEGQLQVILVPDGQLTAIQIKGKSRTTYINTNSEFRSFFINPKDLLKAACCNLSESFETNPSVDVSYNDAVTGSKQIQLLGLSGNYTQLTVENLPGPRGLATPLGLNSIAGPWIESIQLSKGTGSVVNGYESIAGQINVELKKPENSEKLYLNGYVNDMGRVDLNVNFAKHLNKNWSTGLLLHDDFLNNKMDINKDGFRDLPNGNLFSGINRWNFDNAKGLMIQFGAKVLIDKKTGGEMAYRESDKLTTNHYGLGIQTNRYEGFAKIGYVFPRKKYQSIGLQLSTFSHQQDSYFGLINYDAEQNNFYANLIYQSIIGNTAHKFRTGLSFNADRYHELYKTQLFKRKEITPGAFFEYTYTLSEKLSAVAGIRADHNNLYGFFATPRLNVKYEPFSGTVIRFSLGRGQRTANIFAENMGALVSSRQVQIFSNSSSKAYGLSPEVAWNKGISIDQQLKLFERDAVLSMDYFRNDFTSQVVVDREDVRQLKFYDLQGKSFSNSFQAEFNFKPSKKLDVRLAYRLFDVKTTYGNQLLHKPFAATHRAFANAGYEVSGWKFDYTINFVGEKRIPTTSGNPSVYQMPATSPSYVSMNAQVSKTLGKNKNFDLYVGGENLTNYFQKTTILAADLPCSNYFDASMIWGPVSGRTLYAGFRFKIP